MRSVTPDRADSFRHLLNETYAAMEGSEIAQVYSARHGLESAAVLTIIDDETASLVNAHLVPRIEGKTVVEIGGGIGLLACYLAVFAKRVFCIEANPMWSSAYLHCLHAGKPKNLSYLFGAADEFTGMIEADVALFCTHSGIDSMRKAAALFAPVVIDVYGELIEAAPERFDPFAREMRKRV